jgi:hypothetical protein
VLKEASLHEDAFLTSALDGGEWLASRPGRFTSILSQYTTQFQILWNGDCNSVFILFAFVARSEVTGQGIINFMTFWRLGWGGCEFNTLTPYLREGAENTLIFPRWSKALPSVNMNLTLAEAHHPLVGHITWYRYDYLRWAVSHFCESRLENSLYVEAVIF